MTVQTMLFEIPYGQWHRTALVLLGKILSESNAWRWIEGKLEPPSNFVDSARIAKGVSKVLGRGKPNAETVPANAKVDWGLQHPQFFVLEGLAES
ncbi:MAG: hypothetical protein Q8P03_00845, partial [bacterium]|nr:hypothetical protein [bacterium]